MIIPLTEKYRIEHDAHAWQLSELIGTKKPRWQGIRWYNTLQEAAEAGLTLQLAKLDLEGADAIIAALSASTGLICDSIRKSGIPDRWVDTQ